MCISGVAAYCVQDSMASLTLALNRGTLTLLIFASGLWANFIYHKVAFS